MSRDIKFRVWDTKLQKMMGWNPFIRFDDSDYVVQQFTGLFDSNNKEIYEGDVLKFSSDFYDDEICEVKFGKGIFDGGHYSYMGFYLQKGEKILEPRQITSLTNGEGLFKVEVIGNSFNNQELLS